MADAERGIEEFGIPLTPDELDDLLSRRWWDPVVFDVIRKYGDVFPHEFAGQYPNLGGSGVVVNFTDRIDRHRKALANLLPLATAFDVRKVEWSYKDLEAFADLLEKDRAWFQSIGVVTSITPNVQNNRVRLGVTGPKPAIGLIEARFRAPWLETEWNGPLPWDGPRGDLRITVVDQAGQPVPRAWCRVQPADPDSVRQADSPVVATDDGGVCRLNNYPAVAYQVSIHQYIGNDRFDPDPIIEFSVVLRPNDTERSVVVPAG